jgi:Phosphoribosyl-ATP pyrophosphohydrolase
MNVTVRSEDLVRLLDATRHHYAGPGIDTVRARLERCAHQRNAPSPEEMLREFQAAKKVHGGVLPDAPTNDVPPQVRDCRIALLAEEVEELRVALLAGDLVGIADGVADVVFVAVGTAVTYGLPFDALLTEVFRSNMTKTNPPDALKLAKGPGYEPPDIAGVLGLDWQLASDGRFYPAEFLLHGHEPERR